MEDGLKTSIHFQLVPWFICSAWSFFVWYVGGWTQVHSPFYAWLLGIPNFGPIVPFGARQGVEHRCHNQRVSYHIRMQLSRHWCSSTKLLRFRCKWNDCINLESTAQEWGNSYTFHPLRCTLVRCWSWGWRWRICPNGNTEPNFILPRSPAVIW